MASFFNISSRFGRQPKDPNKGNVSPNSDQSPTIPASSPSNLQPPTLSPLSQSPAPSAASMSTAASAGEHNSPYAPPMTASPQKPRVPYFFREECSQLIAKGNFLTLAAKPEHVDLGEWLAHQVVEQYRLLEGMIKIIQGVDEKTGLPLCNPTVCPTMSAPQSYTYTWLDRNKNPTRIPAAEYISLIQKWIMGKINDPKLFPTDTTSLNSNVYPSLNASTSGSSTPIAAGPTNLNMSLNALAGKEWLGKPSGFPESFETDIKSLYRQMFRCYAHIYHGHWLEPFYHLSATKELNTCFVHFLSVAKVFDLLQERDVKPMQPLIDIWTSKKLLPTPGEATSAIEQQSAPA